MTNTVIDVRTLTKTEHMQDAHKVAVIAKAMGTNASEIVWDDQPAIIIDEAGEILDGHHRVAAALAAGLNEWRALIVSRAAWDAQYAAGGHVRAAKWAASEADDAITLGAL